MSNKKVSRSRRKYDVTFKEDVIKMVASGRPISEVSQALGVSASLIHRWYKSSHHTLPTAGKSGISSPTSHSPSLDEIERLKAELRRTEQERDILKKALGIFSRGI
jgi:transposase